MDNKNNNESKRTKIQILYVIGGLTLLAGLSSFTSSGAGGIYGIGWIEKAVGGFYLIVSGLCFIIGSSMAKDSSPNRKKVEEESKRQNMPVKKRW